MALPMQLLIVGPLACLSFYSIFIRKKGKIARKFCLTFFNMRNIIGIERVADQRKSSFATRFSIFKINSMP